MNAVVITDSGAVIQDGDEIMEVDHFLTNWMPLKSPESVLKSNETELKQINPRSDTVTGDWVATSPTQAESPMKSAVSLSQLSLPPLSLPRLTLTTPSVQPSETPSRSTWRTILPAIHSSGSPLADESDANVAPLQSQRVRSLQPGAIDSTESSPLLVPMAPNGEVDIDLMLTPHWSAQS